MAQVLGESGRYVSQEAVRKRQRIFILALTTMTILGAVAGFVWGLAFHGLDSPIWVCSSISAVALLFTWGLGKWSLAKVDALSKEQLNWQKGANKPEERPG